MYSLTSLNNFPEAKSKNVTRILVTETDFIPIFGRGLPCMLYEKYIFESLVCKNKDFRLGEWGEYRFCHWNCTVLKFDLEIQSFIQDKTWDKGIDLFSFADFFSKENLKLGKC